MNWIKAENDKLLDEIVKLRDIFDVYRESVRQAAQEIVQLATEAIAGLEAEIARRDAVIEAQAEEIERLRVILRWIYARADESDGGRIYFLGKELDQIKAAIEAANEQS